MRSYRIDDLLPEQVERFADHMRNRNLAGSLDGLFWLEVPDDLLANEQKEHKDKCGPYSLSVETGEDWVQMELLVRARSILRCSCVAYATPAQREPLIDMLDTIFKELDIPV